MMDWFGDHQVLAWWLIAFSVVTFVATLVGVPLWLTHMPADHFTRAASKRAPGDSAVTRVLWRVGRNVLGYLLILAGILMLVLPGQGALTIFAGIVLADFPRKQRLLRWLVSRGPVLRFINKRRKKAGRAPLKI